MRWPLDNVVITQKFGANPQYYGPGGHTGTDLGGNPIGYPIKAPADGTVISVGTNPGYIGGLYVIVREDEAEHLEYYMGHMSEINTLQGRHVTKGEVIGKVGQTGQATGPHVHFQIRRFGSGSLLDPELVYIRKGEEVVYFTNEQENGLVETATGAPPGSNYSYKYAGKEITNESMNGFVQLGLKLAQDYPPATNFEKLTFPVFKEK